MIIRDGPIIRKNAQGQNTLVFNPEKYPVLQQDPKENAPIIAFESNASGGYSVVDLSNVYKASAISAYRGLKCLIIVLR